MNSIQTVTGPIEPGELGVTLMHEHLQIDFLAVPEEAQASHSKAYVEEETKDERWSQPISLANYYDARRNPFLYRDALQLTDHDATARALATFRASGGSCIVEVTPIGVGRDPELLRRFSEESGVKVVMGSGYYVRDYHPPGVAELSEDEVLDRILRDVQEGTGDAAIKPGIIGEIGLAWPVHPDEEKVLRAAARAQVETGLTLTIHPGRDTAAPREAIRIVEEAGGDPGRTIICHIDRTLFELDDMLELARTGCCLEFDLFGWETSYYPLSDIDMPNDARRVDYVIALGEAGHADQVLVSHDVDSRPRLGSYGGEGYEHILERVVPVMLRKGMTQQEVDRLLIDNPRRCLTRA